MPESGEWVAPGQRGKRIAGGKVSGQDRWWSGRWWRGHHLKHKKSDGEWADGPGGRAARRHHKAMAKKAAAGRKVSRSELQALEYQNYLEARHQQADRATSGHAPSAYFSGRPRAVSTAPEELRDWFRANGPNLTASEYRQQSGWFAGSRQGVSSTWFG